MDIVWVRGLACAGNKTLHETIPDIKVKSYIETRLLRYVSEGLLFTSKHMKMKLSKMKEMCGTGSL